MKENYQVLFSEIINRYSSVYHSFFKKIYIRHLSYLEVGNLDSEYSVFLEEAIKRGVPTYQEKEFQIIKNGLWSKNEEDLLTQNEKLITNLKINISKDFLDSRRKMLRGQIIDIQKDINKMRIKKDTFIGETAEYYANRQLTYKKILNCYSKDIKFESSLIPSEEEEIKSEHYGELVHLYNQFQDKFNQESIKMLAISPFFTSIFYLSSDDAFNFYGRPIVELSIYQCDLFSWSRYFKNVLSNRNDIPNEIKNNPNDLMDWLEIRENAIQNKIINQDEEDGDGGGKTIVGATKKDYEILGLQVSKNSFSEKLKQSKTGMLDKEQLFRDF